MAEEREQAGQPRPLYDWLEKNGIKTQVDVHFYFGPHGEEALMPEELSESINESDLIFLEGPGAPPELQNIMQRVSNGEITLTEADQALAGKPGTEPFYRYVRKLIHGTHKRVAFIDMSHDDPDVKDAWKTADEVLDFGLKLLEKDSPPKFREAQILFIEIFEKFARHNITRETRATEQFATKLLDALKASPDVHTKDRIKVQILFGGAHTSLQKRMRDAYPDTHRARLTHPSQLHYSYRWEYLRFHLWGIPVPNHIKKFAFYETIASVIITPMIARKAMGIRADGFDRYLRAAARELKPTLWEALYRKLIIRKDVHGATADLARWLRDAGIPTDADSQEFRDFLNR